MKNNYDQYNYNAEIFTQALQAFVANKPKAFKVNNNLTYAVTANALLVRYFDNSRLKLKQDVLAYRTSSSAVIGNSSVLNITTMRQRGLRVTQEQTEMQTKLPMIPFVVLKSAGLNIDSFRELDLGLEETIYAKYRNGAMTETQKNSFIETNKILDLEVKEWEQYDKQKRYEVTCKLGQHFTGARLFSCVNKDTGLKSVYLMDVDREELKHGIINPFLVNIPDVSVSTIAAAYESLKPAEVKQAQTFERQGEWFFLKALDQVLDESKAIQGVLRAGSNRPNWCEMFLQVDGKFYVKGKVSHSGREHRDLVLEQWHRALPNTATQSWQITGDID